MRIQAFLLVLAVLGQYSAPVAAQERDSGSVRGFGWFVSAGGERSADNDLNVALAAAGYGEPARSNFTLGGGGYAVVGRILIGGEGYGSIRSAVSSTGGRQVRPSSGSGMFTLGAVISQRPNVRFYPYAGIGGRGISLRLDNPTGTGIGPDINDPTFSQVLADPGKRSDISTGALALNLGVGIDLLSSGRIREGRTRVTSRGLLIGVRAGYQWTPARDDWRLYYTRVIGGPDDIGAGWYARVNVGGGGWVQRVARTDRASR